MHCDLANTIAAEACALRLMYPDAPAREVLALICNGRDLASLDFGSLTVLPHPFARLVAEAVDDDEEPLHDWLACLGRQLREHRLQPPPSALAAMRRASHRGTPVAVGTDADLAIGCQPGSS